LKLTQKQALKMGLCKRCNLYRQTGKNKPVMCVATLWPSLNYKNIPEGWCALDDEQQKRMKG